MKSLNYKRQQGAAALLAVLILIFVFTAIAVSAASRNKISTKMAGSAMRYQTVYEAAEATLTSARDYLATAKSRNGEPLTATTTPSFRPSNFDQTTIVSNMSAPSTLFIWSAGALNQSITGVQARVDFLARIDDPFWLNNAIQSIPATFQGLTTNNNIQNIVTYTFIEEISVVNGLFSGSGGVSVGGSLTPKPYYLITVRASSYEPGAAPTNTNSKENVILQVVEQI